MIIEEHKVKQTRRTAYFVPEIIKKSFRLAEVNKTWLSFNLGPEGQIHKFEVQFYKIDSTRSRYTICLQSIEGYQEVLELVPSSKRTEFRKEIIRNIEHIVGVSSTFIRDIKKVLSTRESFE